VCLFAGIAAATFKLLCTGFTLNEKKMASFVGTVDMSVCRFPADMAVGDDVVADPFTQAFIENEIFSDEFILKPVVPDLAYIVDDPTFEMEHIRKAVV
jgi:hypothetical protein